MKIRVLSDLHLEHTPFDHGPMVNSDLVILAGDIHLGANGVAWAKECFKDQPVFYVPGNHEYYYGEVEQVLSVMRDAANGSNVQVLDRNVIDFCGVRFIGATLWTDYRLFSGDDPHEEMYSKVEALRGIPDFDGRIQTKDEEGERAISPTDTQRWHMETREWLTEILNKQLLSKTVVISHHAPSAKSIGKMYQNSPYSPAFASNIESLVSKADLWIHGHTHEPVDYRVKRCRVFSNPRGYESEVQSFRSNCVITL